MTPAPEPCTICELDPDDTDPVETQNRGLFNVNDRYTYEPICDDHDDVPTSTEIRTAYKRGGIQLVRAGVDADAFTIDQAREHLPDKHTDELPT